MLLIGISGSSPGEKMSFTLPQNHGALQMYLLIPEHSTTQPYKDSKYFTNLDLDPILLDINRFRCI